MKEIVQSHNEYTLTVHDTNSAVTSTFKSWHYLPEIELVCIPQGKGRLNIASKVYEYSNGVVILMHSNIPHKSFDNDFESENYKEMVLQIAPEKMSLLNTHFPNPNQLILHSLTCLLKESY